MVQRSVRDQVPFYEILAISEKGMVQRSVRDQVPFYEILAISETIVQKVIKQNIKKSTEGDRSKKIKK